MSRARRALLATAVVAFLIGIGILILVLTSTDTHASGVFAARGAFAAYTLVIGWGFAGTGLYAWARRPGNNVGPLMTAVGIAWLLQGLAASGDGVLFTVGTLARPLTYGLLVHLLLVFPSGRLETRGQRWLAALVYIDVTALQVASFVFTDTTASYANCDGCPSNPILVSSSESLSGLLAGLQAILALVVLVGLVLVLHRRWRQSAAGQRRALSPILAVGALALFALVLGMLADGIGADPVSDGAVILTWNSPTGSPKRSRTWIPRAIRWSCQRPVAASSPPRWNTMAKGWRRSSTTPRSRRSGIWCRRSAPRRH
jgi:hypothetical protein